MTAGGMGADALTQQSLRSAVYGVARGFGKAGGDARVRRRAPKGRVSIAGAAIRYSDLGVRALPLPATHDDIRDLVAELHGSRAGKHKGELGYISNRGGFVKPKEALVIARHAGQLAQARIRSDELCLEYLYREDVRDSDRAAGRPARSEPRPAGAGPFALWGQSRRGAGALVSQRDLRRQLARTSASVVAMLLLVWLLSNGLPQLAAGIPGGTASPKLAAQAALYLIMGLAVAQVIDARGARFRRAAIKAFAVLVTLTLLQPVMLRGEMEFASSAVIGATLALAMVTVVLFARVRLGGALLLATAVAWMISADMVA
jgi:tryptophan-rich sensory protein